MRVAPLLNRYNPNANNAKKVHTKFERKSENCPSFDRMNHKYTGVASTDLAYASMFDNAIARDLKLMGLI